MNIDMEWREFGAQVNRDARLRLKHLREQAEAAGEVMRAESTRFARIAASEPTRAVSAFNLFQTPEPLAARMASMLAGCPGPWLEPSAGLARLYRAARGVYGGPLVLVENNPDCARELYNQHAPRIVQRDFLTCGVDDLGGPFGAVLMNPPFERGRDIKHIRHARAMLAPGGVLVALCFDGVRQRRELRPLSDTWEPLPPDTFRSEGTRAGVVLLTMNA